MKISQYFTNLRRTKQSVPVFLGHPVRPPRYSVIAGDFERWKLTVTAAESISMCDVCTAVSTCLCSSQLFVTLPLTSATAENPIWLGRGLAQMSIIILS